VRGSHDCPLYGFDDRLLRRARLQRGAEPVHAGVVVGEQQIVLRREVAIEGPQRHPGVGSDLFGRRLLDPLRDETHQRGPSQGLARAFTARGLSRPSHVRKVPQAVYVNIDKTWRDGETPAMVALLVHALPGIATVWFTIASNPKIFSRPS